MPYTGDRPEVGNAGGGRMQTAAAQLPRNAIQVRAVGPSHQQLYPVPPMMGFAGHGARQPGMPGGPPLQLASRGGPVHRGGGPRTGPRPSGGMKGRGGGGTGGTGGTAAAVSAGKIKIKPKSKSKGGGSRTGFDLDAALGNTKTL